MVKVVIIVDYITSRIKSLILELEFITLKIESFDLDRWFQELCRFLKSHKKLEGVLPLSFIAPSSWIVSDDKILPPLSFFAQGTLHIQNKQH